MRITRTATVLGSLIAIAAPAAVAGASTGASDLEPVENPAPRAGVDEELTRIIPGTLGASVGPFDRGRVVVWRLRQRARRRRSPACTPR